MKKIVESIDPVVIAASGVDEQAVAQANLSEDKNIKDLLTSETELLGGQDETEDNLRRDRAEH